jgi:3-hydroxybutyryl-CoA dehydrogenase
MAKSSVLVVGGGRMGSQIACEYAIGGHQVSLVSRTEAPVRERLAGAFATALQARLTDEDGAQDAQGRIAVFTTLNSVSSAPDLVVESIIEDESAKGELLRDIAIRWPDATIASNTSSLSITRLGKLAGAEERILETHYWNPPLLMPLVEVIAGENTDRDRLNSVTETLRSLGKRPVLVDRDVPGFVWNRLQFALLREAIWIVEQGVATPQVVDEIVRDGLARRWRYTGPFETMALGGATTFERVAENLFPELSCEQLLLYANQFIDFDGDYLEMKRKLRDDGLRRDLMTDFVGTTRS